MAQPRANRKRLKILDGGILREAVLYDYSNGHEPPKVRAPKQRASSEAQKRMNLKNAVHMFELRLAKNFPTPGSAIVFTLTYRPEDLPHSRDPKADRQRVVRDKDRLLADLRKERQRLGLPAPRTVYCIEVLTSDTGRWHIHLVVDATGNDVEMIRRLWKKGDMTEATPLRVDGEKNHETLARYMCKEMRELQDRADRPGLHVWGFSRNCFKVEIETYLVAGDYELTPPEDCEVLVDQCERTEFASWHFIKVRLPAAAFPKKPRSKRPKRRRPNAFL